MIKIADTSTTPTGVVVAHCAAHEYERITGLHPNKGFVMVAAPTPWGFLSVTSLPAGVYPAQMVRELIKALSDAGVAYHYTPAESLRTGIAALGFELVTDWIKENTHA